MAVSSLAIAADSGRLVPSEEDINCLNYKLPFIAQMLKEYNIADDLWELTRSQVKYLLRFGENINITHRIKTVINQFII